MDRYLKCDLHIHSSSCWSRHYSKEDFLKKLRTSDLDVISITDHNIIDVELYNEIRSDNTIKKEIIGGIEINVNIDDITIENEKLDVKENNYFHGIIWYDFSRINEVWECVKKLITMDYTIISKKEFDKKSISEMSNFAKEKVFSLKEIQEKLVSINHYFIFHEGKSDRNLSDYLGNNNENNKKFKQRLFYYNNSLAIEGTKKSKFVTNYMENHLNTIVSRFLFSDPQTIEEIGSKYTWINFGGKFDDLILAISDPETRVFTSENKITNPQENLNNFLESIKLKIKKDGNFIERELFFSPGMNGIIGSRGSGKTLLGNILGNSDVEKYKDYIDVESIEYKMKDSDYTRNSPVCKYLKQNTLLKIYENGDYQQLDFIEKYYSELLETKKSKVKTTITEIKQCLELEKNKINTFFKKYKGNLFIWDFLKKPVSTDVLIKKIDIDKFPKIKEMSATVVSNIELYNSQVETLNTEFSNLIISDLYPESINIHKKLNAYKKDIGELFDKITKNNEEMLKYLNDYDYKVHDNRTDIINIFKEMIDKNNSNISNEAEIYQNNMDNLSEFFKDLLSLRIHLFKSYNKIINLYDSIYIDNLNMNLDIDDGVINISTSLKNKTEYLSIVKEQVKPELLNYEEFLILILFASGNIESMKNKYLNGNKFKNINTFDSLIDKFYSNIFDRMSKLDDIKLEIEFNNKSLENYSPGKRTEILLDIFLHIDVIDDNKYKYIILDQPEDNLDTDTIIRKLVNKIRKIKLTKQIFIISHSAPVIINSDSNLVICSKEIGNEINYDYGEINSSNIKKDIVDILDGGEKNLKVRLNKYDFQYERSDL
ncbi:MAG: hypothetical protein PHI05_00065 [Bacilli bacterium]|nr:hypothetical protein [Bacilli bacterium]